MKQNYVKPEIQITAFTSADIITASGLINGGENGKPISESFGSLFEK